MPLKTITVYPEGWQVRDDPYGELPWSPSVGAANMLKANDGDYAVCNSGGMGADSDPLDALTFKDGVTGALPVFESGARNPVLTVYCVMQSTDGKLAQPAVFIYDARFMGKVEQVSPFAAVYGGAAYSKVSNLPANVNIFDAMATGNFRVTCIFPARPPVQAVGLLWNQVYAVLTYTYGGNTTPDPFDFADGYGGPGAVVTSQAIAITGITDGPQLVSISGDASATFSIAGGAFSAAPRNIANGQTLQLRMTAPALGASVSCTVQVEQRADVWNVTAGNDVPSVLNPPADQINVMPGSVVQFLWQPRGNDVPMAFSFSGWPGSYSIDNTATFVDSATPGVCPVNGNIYLNIRAPLGPSMVATPVLTYSSANLTDSVNATTGDENFIYSLDLSPIDTFQVAHAGQATTWDPVASGAARHLSVGSPQSYAHGAAYSTFNSSVEVGRWWRLVDGTKPNWIAGTRLVGIGYGSVRQQYNASYQLNVNTSQFALRDAAGGAYSDLPGSDAADGGPLLVVLNGSAPGIIPAGWSADAILNALKADTFAMGSWATLRDIYGYTGGMVANSALVLRVFFRVLRPPEGMTWEF